MKEVGCSNEECAASDCPQRFCLFARRDYPGKQPEKLLGEDLCFSCIIYTEKGGVDCSPSEAQQKTL